MSDGPTYFHYRDARGVDVITTEFSSIPADARSHVEIVEPGPTPPSVRADDAVVAGVHVSSFVLGVACALACALVVTLISRRRGRGALVFSAVAGVTALAALGALYFGWVLRSAGLSTSVLASPSEAVDDARHAVDSANRATRAQQRALGDVEK